MVQRVKALIVGGGASGITISHTLKHKLGQHDFVVVERTGSIGGTWSEEINNYPGCGVDIPSHFYSFSFNPNPEWSHTFCRHDELSRYMNDTVDKFGLRPHFKFRTEVVGADWRTKSATGQTGGYWEVCLRDTTTRATEIIEATILLSAVGSLSVPKDMKIDGLDQFQGEYWHSATWNTSYDWKGKRVAIIGNGCSATQIVPDMLHDGVGSLVQFGQSSQYYMPREDPAYPQWQCKAFRYIPLYLWLYRFWRYYKIDSESITLELTPRAKMHASKLQASSINHIRATAPSELAEQLIPKDMLGCKRRVMDGTAKGSYLASLNNPRIDLVPSRAVRVDRNAIYSKDGKRYEVDALCFCIGYKATEPLVPMIIRGKDAKRLDQVWQDDEGAHAFQTVSVSGFPNMALLFGPNAVPSNNSCIFKIECAAEYIERFLLRPLLVEQSCEVIDVKRDVEMNWVRELRGKLATMVWASGCANWYINKWGHNTSTFPGCGLEYRRGMLVTRFSAFDIDGKNGRWALYRFLDLFTYWPWALFWATLCIIGDRMEKVFPIF